MTSARRSLPAFISEFVRDSADAWGDHGLGGLIQEWREWIVFPVFRHGSLIVIEQDLEEDRPEPLSQDVTVYRKSDADNWSGFASIANRRMIARMRRALIRGRNCIVACRDGRIIGYTWISDRVDSDLELFPIPLPKDAAYGWNLYVTPVERNAGVGSALVTARLNLARQLGFRRMWRAIDAKNAPTVRTVEKTWGSGSRIVGKLKYVKILVWSRGWLLRETDPRALVSTEATRP